VKRLTKKLPVTEAVKRFQDTRAEEIRWIFHQPGVKAEKQRKSAACKAYAEGKREPLAHKEAFLKIARAALARARAQQG
jgi:hypothetical protein